MPTVFFLSNLKKGADAKEYEKWVQRVDYPLSKKIKPIKSYRVHRINGAFEGQKKYDYIEVIEITNLDDYKKELASPEVKQLLKEWANYIGESHAVYGEAF
jgi:predicted metal-dependent hydrolase